MVSFLLGFGCFLDASNFFCVLMLTLLHMMVIDSCLETIVMVLGFIGFACLVPSRVCSPNHQLCFYFKISLVDENRLSKES